MNPKKWLVYSFTPILAVSMMSGVAMASKHKKKKNADATTSQTAQTASASTHKRERKTKSKAAETTQTAAAPAQQSGMSASHANSSKASRGHEASQTRNPAEINQAKAKGMVWVNPESKVYHTGGRYYGNTKHGQFMTLQQAKQAGYRPAKR